MADKSWKRRRLSLLLFLIYLVLAAGIVGAGYLYYRNFEKMIFLVGALLLGAGVGLIWRQQRLRFYRARAQEAETLRESEERYRILFDEALDGICLADVETGLIIDCNRALAALVGRERAELIGQSQKILHPTHNDQEAFSPTFKQHLTEKEGRILETQVVTGTGLIRDVEIKASFLNLRGLKVLQGVFRDITERKRAEEALAGQKRIADVFLTVSDDEMFNAVLKIILETMQSPHGVFGYIDEAGALVVPSMTRHIRDKCQVPDKTLTFPRDTWGDSSWPRAVREKKPNYTNEISTKTPKGHIGLKRHVSLPILFRGEVIGLFQVANKETDYTEADIRTLETIAGYVAPILSSRLHHQRHEEELQKKNDELTRFTYAVSHDLKSPLVTINTFLGYLEQDARKPDAAGVNKDVGYIRAATDKMSRLLDELLELSRVGRIMNPSVEAPLQEIVKEALDLVAGRIAARGVKVKVTGKPILL